MKKKKSGQVYTPDHLVREIMDTAGYGGNAVLGKHVIDNSCGDGAFLKEIVKRYCNAFLSECQNTFLLKQHLERYVHGIEIVPSEYLKCLENLNDAAKQFNLYGVCWDVLCGDALKEHSFDGKVDYVLGNPPYVRVHNMKESYDLAKQFRFAHGGMTDLYLAFFEIGFKMLKTGGRLCYVTPSSWLTSLAGKILREYTYRNENLLELIDLGHLQVFDATTYTIISLFIKGFRQKTFLYSIYDGTTLSKRAVGHLSFSQACIGGMFYLGKSQDLSLLKTIRTTVCQKRVVVKNGFATLADDVFIKHDFPFSSHVISVVKASTGKWYKTFFPYDKEGRPLPYEELCKDRDVRDYLEQNKLLLLKGKPEPLAKEWFLYGRTQAVKDVWRTKIAVNTCVKDLPSIKINVAPAGVGVYSGLYIIADVGEGVIRCLLMCEDFLNYVKLLKKYKSGGYYTFNSKDLELYLNFRLHSCKTYNYEQH